MIELTIFYTIAAVIVGLIGLALTIGGTVTVLWYFQLFDGSDRYD